MQHRNIPENPGDQIRDRVKPGAKDQVARNQEASDQKDRYRGGEADKERLSDESPVRCLS
jgi:hypothetical protein